MRKRSVVERTRQLRQAEKLTFRLAPQYAEKVYRMAEEADITPNQLGRIATMAVVNNGFLELSEKMARMEDQLIRLRQDFNDVVIEE